MPGGELQPQQKPFEIGRRRIVGMKKVYTVAAAVVLVAGILILKGRISSLHGSTERADSAGEVEIKDRLGNTLEEAARSGSLDGIKYLVDAGADPNYANGEAMAAAVGTGHIEAFKAIVAANGNPRCSVLSAAAARGDVPLMRYIVAKGATLEGSADAWVGNPDCSALRAAVRNKKIEAVRFLVSQGANIHFRLAHDPSTEPIAEAKASGDPALIAAVEGR